MKILLIHQYFLGENDAGGSRFNQFVKYWVNKGHEVTIVAGTVHYATGKREDRYKGKWITKEKQSDKVNVVRTFVSESYNASFLGRIWAYLSFAISALTACLFVIRRHDVLIVTSPPLFVGLTGILTSIIRRIPMLFEVRDLWPESAIDTGVLKNKFLIKAAFAVEKLSYGVAKKINVLTPAFKSALIEHKKVCPEKICYIPNGADLDIFQPGEKNNWVREKYNLKGKFVISYLGAHGVANHLDYILDVAKEGLDYKEIVFLFIGDGMERNRLLERAMKENITNVQFILSQPKSKISDFCNASDVCTAVLKKVETFKTVYPNKVFDYMSCAKPIIIGIDGLARQLVEESNSGYYVDPENIEEFKQTILKLYYDKKLCNELGENGYNYVKKHFSRESLAEKYERELLQLL
jgi:glycosyltransferase involved in cell wall biosynthesis